MMEKQIHRDDINLLAQHFRSTTMDSNLNINEKIAKKKCNSSDESLIDLPGMNLPEKLLFVIDTVQEFNSSMFEAKSGYKYSPLYMIKRVIEIFVNAKSEIQSKHEFALMTLRAKDVSNASKFTADRKAFFALLEKAEEDHVNENIDIYDLGPCFEAISDIMKMEENLMTPKHVYRVIFIYGRSHAVPTFSTRRQYFDRLHKNPHFFLDSLYVHEPSDNNDCQTIYERLCTFDVNCTSYILEVGRNLAALHMSMAKLLAHPLQRAKQDNSPYTYHSLCSLRDT